MAREGQPERLYDFLYRDSSRLTSYYAQLFGGLLSSLERTDVESQTTERTGKLDRRVAGGEAKSAKGIEVARKETTSPHELIATDVLSALIDGNFISSDVANAAHGSLVIAHGTVVFVDSHILTLASALLDALIPVGQQSPASAMGLNLVKSFLTQIALPSAFLLRTDGGHQVVGTIKESGMEEPITVYYFKHGTAGLSDVYLMGVKEVPSSSFTLPEQQLIGLGQKAAQGLSDSPFPRKPFA